MLNHLICQGHKCKLDHSEIPLPFKTMANMKNNPNPFF